MRSKKASPYGKRRLKEGLSIVTKFWNVTNKELLGKSRHRHIMNARHSLRYYLSMGDEITAIEIGLLTNGDHASVLHSRKMFETYREYDADYKFMYKIFIGEHQYPHKVSDKVRLEDILVCGLPVREKRLKIESLYENR